jgi:uncharacterized protein
MFSIAFFAAAMLLGQQSDSGPMRDARSSSVATEKEAETVRALAGHVEQIWLKSCASRNGPACFLYGLAAMNGSVYVAKDEAEAVTYFHKGCDYNDAYGCRLLASALVQGRGTPVDLVGARAALEKACSGNDAKGCTRLGAMVSGGNGGPVDSLRGAQIMAQACKLGDVRACPDKTPN